MNAKTRAFLEGINSGKFNSDRAKIYQIISQGVQTIETLRLALGKRHHNQISGRITELLDMGLIKEILGKRFSLFVQVTDPNEISKLSKQRDKERYERWVNVGNNKGWR